MQLPLVSLMVVVIEATVEILAPTILPSPLLNQLNSYLVAAHQQLLDLVTVPETMKITKNTVDQDPGNREASLSGDLY